jgi:hypothetical protein
MYGRREFGAAAFPPEAHTVANLFGFGHPTDWRMSAGGVTFLAHYDKETIPLQQPGPVDVIFKTLAALGWQNAKISPAGNVAYQMMRHLGGPFGIRLLKNRKLIEFLEWLSKGQGRTAVAQHFFTKMREISSSYFAVRDIHSLVERYTDAKMFSLGVEVQCAICTQRSWHSVDVSLICSGDNGSEPCRLNG